jgi:hypothetical protein
VEHIERITQLIIDICGTPDTNCGPMDDQQPNMPVPARSRCAWRAPQGHWHAA